MFAAFLRTRIIPFGLLLCLLTLCSATVFAQGGGVRYSYEKVKLGSVDEWMLVPKPEPKISGRLTKSRVIDAFDVLIKHRKNIYGASSIKITGRLPNAHVSVAIDRNLSKWSHVIMAETVYTLTELGIKGVSFPGYSSGILTRADIPNDVYTLTVPMWKAIGMTTRVGPGQILFSDGSTVDSATFYRGWKKRDAALVNQLYGFLKSPHSYTVTSVLSLLPSQKVSYVDQVIPMLSSDMLVVRQKALEVLANKRTNIKVLDAVASRLKVEKDDKHILEIAAFLGASSNKKFKILEPLYLLARGSEADSLAAILSLLSYRDDVRVVQALATQLKATRPQNIALSAAQALAKLDANAVQMKALEDSKITAILKLAIARDLAMDKNLKYKLTGLSHLAERSDERESINSIKLLSKMKDPLALKLVSSYLSDQIDYKRRAASDALAATKNIAALPALASASKKGKDSELFEDAGYTIMLAQPLKTIQVQAKTKSPIIKRMAYRALGVRAVQENAGGRVFDTLKSGAASRDPLVRGACARALGAFANKRSADVLLKLSKDKQAAVREDVAKALANYKDGTHVNVLVSFLSDSSSAVVAAATDSLGLRKEALAWDKIKGHAASKHGRVRGASLRALARLVSRSDKTALSSVMSMLSGAVRDSNIEVRKIALTQLGTFNDEAAVLSIAGQLSASRVDIRVAAVLALGHTKHVSASELIVNALDDPSLKVRRAAIQAAGFLADRVAKKQLQARLHKEKDDELIALLKSTIKNL